MKILKKNGEYKKLADSSMNDYKIIKDHLGRGWEYSSKKEYKEWRNPGGEEKEIKVENKVEKKEKKEKKIKEVKEKKDRKDKKDKKDKKGKK